MKNKRGSFAESFGYLESRNSFVIGSGANAPYSLTLVNESSILDVVADERLKDLWTFGIKVRGI